MKRPYHIRSGHLGCLIDIAVFDAMVCLFIPILNVCKANPAKWWSLAGFIFTFVVIGLYFLAAITNVPKERWALPAIFAVLLSVDGLVVSYRLGLDGAVALLLPAGFVAAFWGTLLTVVIAFKRKEQSHEQHR